MNFQLSCESTVDLTYEYVTSRNIDVLFYTYIINEKEYIDNMGRNNEELECFYQLLDQGALPKTSQINEFCYEEYFDKLLQKGDVLHITFGTGMTPSYYNALKAATKIQAKYPMHKLIIVDSLCSSCGYGMLIDYCADMRDKGMTMEEIADWAINNRKKIHHQFFSTNLKYFRRSGRVSGPSAIVGSVLKICPLMKLNHEGKIVAYNRVRLAQNAIKKMVIDALENIDNGQNYNGKFFVYHSNCLDLAKETTKAIEEALPNVKERIVLLDIGCIIASHCGQGTVAISYLGSEKV